MVVKPSYDFFLFLKTIEKLMLVLYLMKYLGAQDSCFLKLYLTYNPNILLSTVWNGKK